MSMLPSAPTPPWLLRVSMEFCSLVLPGRMPFVSGTWGSLAAVLLAPWLFLPLGIWGRILALLVVFFIGGYAATIVERHLRRKDPGIVIIDEVVGQWLTFLPFVSLSVWELAVGFVLFRIFDILKPPPVRSSEHWLPEGYGIMIDDVLAGVYSLFLLWVLRLVFA